MHVRIRFSGKPDTIVVVQSKLTKIDQFRHIIKQKFDVPPKLQKLFYGGKLLENGYTFHDYNIKLNDVIQLMVKSQFEGCSTDNFDVRVEEETTSANSVEREYTDAVSTLYEVGDLVDMRDQELGAWFEGQIIRIVQDPDEPYIENINDKSINDVQENIVGTSTNIDENIENIPPLECDSTTRNIELNTSIRGIRKYFNKLPSPEWRRLIEFKVDKPKKQDINSFLLYKVKLDKNDTEEGLYCKLKDIRPRARYEMDITDLKVCDVVMVNYNIDEPSERGHWYDFQVSDIKKTRTSYELIGTLYLGPDAVPQSDTKVRVNEKIYKIEEVVPLAERTKEYKELMITPPEKRAVPFICLTCHDDDEVPCKDCGCYLCLGKHSPEKILLCDECDNGYHMMCLSPPLEELPVEDWYCPSCKRDPNVVIAPGASKQAKKTTKSNRDWGRGMACVGKTKTCAMPPNHFGPIPGIEVGMCWRFRIQLSETGVHRPPVSGIHGRDVEGAYSIVLSGGYEDDVDNGNEFTYTGSGGRDLSGNKRTAEQSSDQILTRENKALARNCAVKVISEEGGDAGDDWRSGKPVRVVRSYKMLKHFPKFAPKEGIRYDGIYKVVKYYPEQGLSGYRVWKYLLRRDDPNPAPWEPEGKEYPIIYPDGYLEAEAEKKAQKLNAKNGKSSKSDSGKKRPLMESNEVPPFKKSRMATVTESPDQEQETNQKGSKQKKKNVRSTRSKKSALPNKPETSGTRQSDKSTPLKKPEPIGLIDDDKIAIAADKLNSQRWEECLLVCSTKGKTEFLERVTQEFCCIICQDVVVSPVTTPCLHNFCMECIKQAFKVSGEQCPCCRQSLANYEFQPNEQLKTALRSIMPGYDAGKK